MWEERRTHTTSSLGSMSLLSRMAFSTAPPSLPVALVRANILIVEFVRVSVGLLVLARDLSSGFQRRVVIENVTSMTSSLIRVHGSCGWGAVLKTRFDSALSRSPSVPRYRRVHAMLFSDHNNGH